MDHETPALGAVEKALLILNTFKSDADQGRLSLAQIARLTGLYKSTILRLIASLESFGYIQKNADGTYQLGPSIYQLGLVYKNHIDEHIIRKVLTELAKKSGETAAFYIDVGAGQRQCLYRVNSHHSARHHLEEGTILPITAGATGHILRAYSTQHSYPNKDALRAQGYYISVGERAPEVASVAVPVFNHQNLLLGALSISGLCTRFNEDERKKALAMLLQAAEELKNQ